MEVGRVNVKITGENSSANAAINQTMQNLKNMSPSLNNIESLMKRAFTAGAIIAAGKQVYDLGMKCVELSSRMNEMQNVISTVFKDSANDINKWAEVTGKAMGRSTLQMADFASQAGAVLSGMGKSGSELNMMSEGFAKLAVDIGSFWNVTDIDAFMALRSAISGEMEPMKRFGVVMTEANLSAFALEQGIRNKISAMSEDEKTTLRYNFLLAKTKDSQGDAEKTMGSYANQVKVLDANFKNLGKTLGDALKPMIQAEIEGLNLLIEAWGELAKKQAITKISEGMINPKNFNKASLQDAKEQTETKLKTAYGTDMMKYESILEGINNEIERQNKLEAENAKIKLRKDIIAKDAEVVNANAKKIQEEKQYFIDLATEIKNAEVWDKALNKTVGEIQDDKIKILTEKMDKLKESGDTTSETFKKVRSQLIDANWDKEITISIDDKYKQILAEGLGTSMYKVEVETLYRDAKIEIKPPDKVIEGLMKLQDEWKETTKVFGSETYAKEAVAEVDKEIDYIKNAISGIDSSTTKGKIKIASLSATLAELKDKKIKVEVEVTTNNINTNEEGSGQNTSGYDPSRVGNLDFGINASNVTKDGISNNSGRKSISTGEGSGAVYNEKQSEYYKKLYSDMADELNKATESVGSAFSDLGDKLNNDFLKSLGDTVSGISDLQQSLEAMKNAKSIGGTAGALGTLSAGLGIAGAVIGIGATIYNAIKPAGDKQMSSADKMNQAVETFKKSIEGSTIQEISTKGKSLSEQLGIKNTDLSKLTDYQNKMSDITKGVGYQGERFGFSSKGSESAFDKWRAEQTALLEKEYGSSLSGIGKKMKVTKQDIDNITAELAIIKPTIIDALNISWQDLASSVRSAFNADNLSDFYSRFKSNLQTNIKDALVSAFLQSDAMKIGMTSLTDDIYKGLSAVGFNPDTSKMTDEQAKNWNTQVESWKTSVDDLSKQGGSFYEVLVKLGLAGTSTAEALTSAANSINSIPQGLKLSLYRYQSIPAKANSWIGTTGSDSNLFPNKPGTTPEMPTVNVYIGSEKITGLVNRVSATNNRNMWGA